jgi:hypothetical protein
MQHAKLSPPLGADPPDMLPVRRVLQLRALRQGLGGSHATLAVKPFVPDWVEIRGQRAMHRLRQHARQHLWHRQLERGTTDLSMFSMK